MSPLADAIIALYERHAVRWDALRRRQPPAEVAWLERFCGGLTPGAAVLDLGCGAGVPIASWLVGRGYDVTGVDASAAMLALFRSRLPAARARQADMRELRLGHSFEGLVAWDSLFHLSHEDQRRMFPILEAHAAAGARLLFTTGAEHGEAIGSLEGEQLYHASLSAGEYEALLALSGFSVVAHVCRDPACGEHTVWLAQKNA